MDISLDEVVKLTDCKVLVNHNQISTFAGVAPLNLATQRHISFLLNENHINAAIQSNAGAILCTKSLGDALKENVESTLLICENAYAAFAKISQVFFKPNHPFSGISKQSYIDESANIDPSAVIFPFVFIGPGAHVGKNSVIYPGCFIGAGSSLGDDCMLYPNVTVREGCIIGHRCQFNPGVVVGGDGFGFAPTPKENVKIPQIGRVVIDDDVELGANTAIDRGTMTDTKIGKQTKIDNLVQIGHNVTIGNNCLIAAQSGIAGSSSLGNHVICGGQVGIIGHLKIGDRVTFSALSGVAKNIPSGSGTWGGFPARPLKEFLKREAILNRLADNYGSFR